MIYDITAIVGAVLILHVMQQTEHDQINEVAPVWLKLLRRAFFIAMAWLLLNTVLSGHSVGSFIMVVESGLGTILINSIALHLRAPPQNGKRRTTQGMAVERRWRRGTD